MNGECHGLGIAARDGIEEVFDGLLLGAGRLVCIHGGARDARPPQQQKKHAEQHVTQCGCRALRR